MKQALSTILPVAAILGVMLTLSACTTDKPASAPAKVEAAAPMPAEKAKAPAPVTSATAASTTSIKLKVVSADSEETASEDGHATNAVDGNPATMWHTQWTDENPPCPHEIIIELIPPSSIKGFTYLPRQDEEFNGTVKDYEFYVSDDEKNFGTPVKKGALANEGKAKQSVTFDAKKGRYIKLKVLSEINGGAWASAAEIGVIPN